MANKRDLIRSKNLATLAELHPDMPIACFKSASHWSQVKGGKPISNAKASEVEELYSLPLGWLDRTPEAQAALPEIDQISQVLSRMVKDKRMSHEEVVGMLQTLLAREKLSPK